MQGEGLSHKMIAGNLNLGLGTVKAHLAGAYRRTHVQSGYGLQGQLRSHELRNIADKIKRLLEASHRHLARSRSWPPLRP